MSTLKYFTPTLRWLGVVADKTGPDGDADANPDTRGITGNCFVTGELRPGEGDIRALRASDLAGGAALVSLASVKARLDDGLLLLTSEQRLRLVASCPALHLAGGVSLVYHFRFEDVTYNAQPQLLPEIIVAAPVIAEDHSDDVPTPGASEILLNLATATWLDPS